MTKHLLLAKLRSINGYNLAGTGCGWCYSVVYGYPGSGDGKGSAMSDFTYGKSSYILKNYYLPEQGDGSGDGYLEYQDSRLTMITVNMEEALD
jgi:hypothetical protein